MLADRFFFCFVVAIMSTSKKEQAARLAERTSGRHKADKCVRLVEHTFNNVCQTDNERRAFAARIKNQMMQLVASVISPREAERRAEARKRQRDILEPAVVVGASGPSQTE